MKSGRYYNRLTDADKKKIVELHQQGVKNVHIAERFNVTPSAIRHIIRKFYKDKGEQDGRRTNIVKIDTENG